MPVLEGRHDGRQILVSVLIAPPLAETSGQIATGTALLDTGASRSLITRELAQQLGLPTRGKRPLVSARGTELVDRYAFRIGFLLGGPGPAQPYILDTDLIGSEFRDHGSFNVIIGMDILATGDLMLRRDGSYRFEF